MIQLHPVNTLVKTKIASLFAGTFRSTFEAKVVRDLVDRIPHLKVEDHYEAIRIPYTVPARAANYTPDLYFADRKLAIELKGRFQDHTERLKYVHFAKSNPDITLKFVLMRPGIIIYKGSKTTQEDWLRKQGFEVAFKTIPLEWLLD